VARARDGETDLVVTAFVAESSHFLLDSLNSHVYTAGIKLLPATLRELISVQPG